MLRERIARARPWTVLAIAWLWLLLYGFPGQMAPDAMEHIIETRVGVYTDGAPPLFTKLFAVSDATFGGQLGVFLLQITAFVLGTYLTMRRLLPRHAHWWALALCLWPPIVTTLPVVWKDSLMPALLLLGFGAILDDRRWVRLLGLGALFAAVAIRYNAFAAVAPIVVLLFAWRPGMHWIKRTAIATTAWLAITFAAFGANSAVTDVELHQWHTGLALFDIAGTLKYTKGTIPDAELSRVLAGTGIRVEQDFHETIRRRYTFKNFFNLIAPPNPIWDVPIRGYTPPPPAQRDAIERAWNDIVGDHAGAYFAHRLRVFRECLALKRGTEAYWAVPQREFAYPWTAEREGISISSSAFQDTITAVFTWVWHATPLFEPWLYFALALLMLPLARKHRGVLALLLSGIAIELTLLLLASSPDFRYSHWLVTCVTISVIALVAQRMRPQMSS